MRRQLVVFVALLGALFGVGCNSGGDGPSSSPSVPNPVNGVYTVALTAATVDGLGPCSAGNAGQVGFVTSTQRPYVCVPGSHPPWIEITCTVARSGEVLYVNVPPQQGLWACVEKAWTQVAGTPGPQGPAGPQGDAGAPGPQGPGSTVTVTPEPPGTNCAAGGQRIDVLDTNADASALTTTYVCNGVTPDGGGAVCFTGESACAGQTPETCVGGQWVFAAAPCPGICVNGVCGDCSPNAAQCGGATGNTVQICDGSGHFQDMQTCSGGTPLCLQTSPTPAGIACTCPSPNTTCGDQCVDTSSDTGNCGQCGTVCAAQTQTCTGGTCTTCPNGAQACNNVCVDPQTDPNNCGSCGTVCAGQGQTCSGGVCTCPNNGLLCNNVCVDPQTDPSNCGSCGAACTLQGQTCVGGTCTCPTGMQLCNNVCVNTQFDVHNCGQCGSTCAGPEQSCSSGVCKCEFGGEPCNDACVITSIDPNNCGGCGIVCGGATPFCGNGACTAACVESPGACTALGQIQTPGFSSLFTVNFWTCDQYPGACANGVECCLPSGLANGWCCAGPPFVAQ